MSQIIIQNGNQSKTVEQNNFPIRIGTDLNSEIVISGSLAEGLSATIDRIGEKYLLQITSQSIDASMNGNKLKGSHWIENEDELIINNAAIQFEHQENDLLISVSDISGEQPTIFEKRQSKGIFENQTIRYIGFSISLVVLYFSFYFFTAKAVKIDVFDDLNGELIAQDSDIKIDGGLFPSFKIGGRYLLRSGEYEISIQNEGYVSMNNETLIIDENESQDRMFDLSRLPGKIVFTTNPGVDFDLYVDDSEVSKATPETFVSAGNRKIELRFDRYFPIEKEIFVNGKGEIQEYSFDLDPSWADVSISTEPVDVGIFNGNERLGNTPSTIQLIQGKNTLSLRKSGYKDYEIQLDIVAQDSVSLESLILSRLDVPLEIISEPEGASININDEYRGLTPMEIMLEPLVEHKILISKPGYKDINNQLRLDTIESLSSKGKNSEVLDYFLEEILGQVSFVGTDGAKVYRSDDLIGVIPFNIEMISEEQILKVKKDGLVTQEIKMTPNPNYPQKIEVKLLNEEQTVLAAIPKTLKTSQSQEMKLILPGSFVMGTPRRSQGRLSNENERLVEITKPFYIGTKEVTNNEFRAFKPKHTSGAEMFRELSNGMHPTVMVTWSDAAAYCNWLSEKESLVPAYENIDGQYKLKQPITNGYRLPTEAEWEWVSRYNGGGGEQRYPWGDSMPPIEESGNYADESTESLLTNVLKDYWDGYPVTAPSGRFYPNKIGIYDLGGNVAEWVSDYYAVPTRQLRLVEKDPSGPADGTARVIKGSSWRDSSLTKLRFAYRDYGTQGRLDVGFRIARYTDLENGKDEKNN
ncbi:MAG: SUMF1/EgtB/PvdO family nonheme iron enzyme [Pseudomonadota bacterium]|nr:SUMF1/EgtB/PvdO family nonheme iron enzyme [Pseudomonadota bacterium]